MLGKHRRVVILGFCLTLILAITPYGLSQPGSTSSPATADSSSSVTVRLDGRSLFELQTKAFAPSVEKRASNFEHLIERFAKSTVPVEALDTLELEGATIVGAENQLLFTNDHCCSLCQCLFLPAKRRISSFSGGLHFP